MTKLKSVKLEFTQISPIQNFNISTKKYGDNISCVAKAAGKQGNDYFSAKFKFVIKTKCSNAKIDKINIIDVTHIGKSNIPVKKCGKFHYYYNINDSDSSSSCSSSSIIDDEFEQNIYNSIKLMLHNSVVTKLKNLDNVSMTLPTSQIENMCMNIKIGTCEFSASSSSCSESSSCSSLSTTTTSSECKIVPNRIIKIIAWGAIISFVLYFLKNKYDISLDPYKLLSNVKNLISNDISNDVTKKDNCDDDKIKN